MSGKTPFHQFTNDNQVIAALQKGNIFPERPARSSQDAIDDDLWALMKCCWGYLPGSRPACQTVRDKLTELGVCRSDDTPAAATGSNYAFWEAVREKSNIEVDYDAVEKILLRVSDFLGRKFQDRYSISALFLASDPRTNEYLKCSPDRVFSSFVPFSLARSPAPRLIHHAPVLSTQSSSGDRPSFLVGTLEIAGADDSVSELLSDTMSMYLVRSCQVTRTNYGLWICISSKPAKFRVRI